MKVRIEIDTNTFVRFWLVVIGFVFVIYLIYLTRTALVILASAAFLALALSAPVSALRKRIPGKSRIAATALAFTAVILFIGTFFFLVVPPIVQQTLKLANNAPQIAESLTSQWQVADSFIERYQLQPQIDNAVEGIRTSAADWLSRLGTGIFSGIGSLFSVLGATLLTLVLAFLMLIEAPSWMRRIWGLYDDKSEMNSHKHIAVRMHNVVSGYVNGQLSVAGIGALATGIIVFILSFFFEQVDANLTLPAVAIAFVLSLIPMFGATIAGILIALLLVVNSLPAAVIFLVYFIVYQQIENNYISPVIQSKYLHLSPLAVLTAVTVGLYLFGLAGGIISIPIAGCIKVLIEEYLDRSQRKHEQAKKPLHKLVKKVQNEA